MTTVLSRGAQTRRGGRRPGWGLLTALLVVAIGASSALVFTSRVELLKLAVIVSLWAAVAAAFVSVIYRRQSDVDQARVRDLKLVYDLQLDREISARREYELTVESQLRRELASELRDQAADEVAALRTELASLRTNLEILFDTDLASHPALENERTTVRAFSDWARSATPDFDAAAHPDDTANRTAENPIIDVSEVPAGARGEHAENQRGSHRRAPDGMPDNQAWSPPGGGRRRAPEQRPHPQHTQDAWARPQQPPPPRPEPHHWAAEPAAAAGHWRPVGAEGQWLPPGTPGSNWASDSGAHQPSTNSHGTDDRPTQHLDAYRESEPVSRHRRHRRAPEPSETETEHEHEPEHEPAETGPPPAHGGGRRAARARHATEADAGPPTGTQSVADLLARLQAGSAVPAGGRRGRRRREE